MMNKFLIGLTLLATLNCAVNCQFLKNKNVKATKPVDQKCLEFLKKDNQTSVCDFYKCFEERFPCGSDYWVINWGYKYCSRYADPAFSKKFTESGQKLLAHINKCVPKFMEIDYKSRSMNCKRFQRKAFRLQGKCYSKVQNLFCQAFPENKELFLKVLDQKDFFNMDSVKMIKNTINKCVPKLDFAKIMFDYGVQ